MRRSPPALQTERPMEQSAPLSAAMRARADRNLRRARALRASRAAPPAAPLAPPDPGGGFLPEPGPASAPPSAPPRPAPRLDPAERPRCKHCGCGIALSYLLDTFQYAVCDACRDAEGAHALLTRTEAKSEYLLQDCDLDSRWEPLPCVRRRNPHAARGDMRLYLRAQLEERAARVWGEGGEALREERERRARAREEAGARRGARRLRALRQQVRSSLFAPPPAPHRHEFAPETYDADADLYSRACACGHTETYEKM